MIRKDTMMADRKNDKGKVWLVGAGPGDAGLLTLKGKQVLQNAQVVVYDQLVGSGILSMIPEQAEKIDAGKHANHHKMEQEQINQVLVEKGMEGKRVVRLKGGDPFLFGRGAEELEALLAADIPFEVVPGVSSAVAVPAYAGIPVTHREYTPSLHIVTAHRKRGNSQGIDFKALAALGDVTLVFFMGVGALKEISEGLIEAGVEKDRPSAVIENGTRWNQRVITAPLWNLPQKAKEAEIKTPGLILVGSVCSLAERFHWKDRQPLGRQRIWVVRPREKESELEKKLRELGAEVMECPATSLHFLSSGEEIRKRLDEAEKGQFQWILFTSAAGVDSFFQMWIEAGKDIRNLVESKIGTVGSATSRALRRYGICADYEATEAYGSVLGKEIAKQCSKGSQILICLPQGVESDAEKYLIAGGCEIVRMELYQIEEKTGFWRDISGLQILPDDIAMFASASSVRAFAGQMEGEELSCLKTVCIGRKTLEEAQKFGMDAVQSDHVTIDSMIDKVLELKKR